MRSITPEEFEERYGEGAMGQFPTSLPEKPSFLQRVGQGISAQFGEATQNYSNYLENPTLGGAFRTGANLAKNASGAILTPLAEAPGFKQLGEGFSKAGQAIVDTGVGNKATDFLARNFSPETLGATSDVIQTGLNVAGIEGTIASARAMPSTIKSGVSKIKGAIPPGGPGAAAQRMAQVTGNQSPAIMNRVARLKPTDATKFEKMAGKTHGDYLSETGNFGTPDKIVATEAQKFTQSKLDVDNALAQLPGEYKVGALKDALGALIEKAKSTSSKSVKSPYLNRVMELAKKYNKQGLNMSEINEVKRLYERYVKLGYNKLLNADKVELSTNIDNALREWQTNKAGELGFNNIIEMNKQTQLSKFLTDKLGEQITGKSGLNEVSLTDWIILSGGDPAAIAGFLTKKFMSSKGVQARIAQMLKEGESKGQVKPDIGPSKVPRLEAPKVIYGQSPKAPTTYEPQAKSATSETINPKTGDRYIRDLKTGEMKYQPKNTKQQPPQPKGKVSKEASSNDTTLTRTVKNTIGKATEFQPEFTSKVQAIASRLGLDIEHGPVKSVNRTIEKALTEKAGRLEDVSDLNRSVIFAKNSKDIPSVAAKIRAEAKAEFGSVSQIKHTLGRPGYNKTIVNVPTPAGMGEIQITTKAVWDAKLNKGGDVLYGIARNPKTSSELRNLLTARMDELYALSPDSALIKASGAANEGGFTMDTLRNIDYGGTPHIAVSPFPERSAIYTGETTTMHIAQFMEKNIDLLSQKGYSLGGWYDKASGQTYLDVVVPVPKKFSTQAVELGKQSNQKAVFDLETFTEIPTGGTGEVAGAASLVERQNLVKSLLTRMQAP